MKFWFVLFIYLFFVQILFGQYSTCTKTDTSLCYIQAPFPIDSKFGIEIKWESEEYVSSSKNPIIGDINGDCIPDIFISSRDNPLELLVLDGVSGNTIDNLTLDLQEPNHTSYAIADLDADGDIELIIDTENIL